MAWCKECNNVGPAKAGLEAAIHGLCTGCLVDVRKSQLDAAFNRFRDNPGAVHWLVLQENMAHYQIAVSDTYRE